VSTVVSFASSENQMVMSYVDVLELRLTSQARALLALLERADRAALTRCPPSGKWSALEHFAHVTRVHEPLVARLNRILYEESPLLSAYRAEADPEWPQWQQMPLDALLAEFPKQREAVGNLLRGLSDDDLRQRTGSHPLYGVMTMADWFEFFLVHEAHHIYVMMRRARGAD